MNLVTKSQFFAVSIQLDFSISTIPMFIYVMMVGPMKSNVYFDECNVFLNPMFTSTTMADPMFTPMIPMFT